MSQYQGQFKFRKPPAEITGVLNAAVAGSFRITSQTDNVVVWERKKAGVGTYLLLGALAFANRGQAMTVTYSDLGDGLTGVDVVADDAQIGRGLERDLRPISEP